MLRKNYFNFYKNFSNENFLQSGLTYSYLNSHCLSYIVNEHKLKITWQSIQTNINKITVFTI